MKFGADLATLAVRASLESDTQPGARLLRIVDISMVSKAWSAIQRQ